MKGQPRVLSGVQPSGNLHIGNYLGAIKQFVQLQEDYDAYFCVVDQHAITVPQKPEELRQNTLNIAMAYLAAGIDPKKAVIFVQSHVPAHTELGWMLNTMTPLGELERMTQFKEKGKVNYEAIDKLTERYYEYEHILQDITNGAKTNADLRKKIKILLDQSPEIITNVVEAAGSRKETKAGILNYPTLMAADILLYQTDVVPVGEDQLQHIELTRSLAERFNNRFGETFKVPKPQIQKETARIMGLDDPTKKMSKSASSEMNYIALMDSLDKIRKKIKSAVTDSGSEVVYDIENKPGIANLLAIYAEFSGKSIKEIEKQYEGSNYGPFKADLAELLVEKLAPFQEKFEELSKDAKTVLKILKEGAERANEVASATLNDAKEKMGFLLQE